MRVIVGGRGTGKTEALLRWAQEAPEGEARVVVSHSLRASHQLQGEARKRGLPLESWQFVSLEEVGAPGFQAGTRLTRRVVLAADNADIVLQWLLRTQDPIDVITATGSVEVLTPRMGAAAAMKSRRPGQPARDPTPLPRRPAPQSLKQDPTARLLHLAAGALSPEERLFVAIARRGDLTLGRFIGRATGFVLMETLSALEDELLVRLYEAYADAVAERV